MKFIQFGTGHLINVDAIADVSYGEVPNPQLLIVYANGHRFFTRDDLAASLWEQLLQHASGSIDTTTLLASIDRADLLDSLGEQKAALTIAAELLAAETDRSADAILADLLSRGKARYEAQTPKGETALQANLAAWDAVSND